MNKNMCESFDYEQFVDYIASHLFDGISQETDAGDVIDIRVVPVIRNNERVTDALRVCVKGSKPYPLIDIDPFYEMYCMGAKMPQVIHELARSYIDSRERQYFLCPDDLMSFDKVKDKIIFRLISRGRNRHVLECCPCRDFLDLSITYRVLTGKSEGGISSMMITKFMMEEWGIDEDILYRLAISNSVRHFPPKVESFGDVVTRLMDSTDAEEDFQWPEGMSDGPGFYVCTNDCGINGAGVICYPGLLEEFGEMIGEDFYILPSSIHEVLFLPAHMGMLPQEVISVVGSANKSVVSREEILSDSVYYFRVKSGKIQKYSGQIAEELLQ